jgi:hypothetical protein
MNVSFKLQPLYPSLWIGELKVGLNTVLTEKSVPLPGTESWFPKVSYFTGWDILTPSNIRFQFILTKKNGSYSYTKMFNTTLTDSNNLSYYQTAHFLLVSAPSALTTKLKMFCMLYYSLICPPFSWQWTELFTHVVSITSTPSRPSFIQLIRIALRSSGEP